MKYFIGIDISKNTFNVHIIDRHGETVNSFKLSQKIQNFLKLHSTLSQLSTPNNIAIGIESSTISTSYHSSSLTTSTSTSLILSSSTTSTNHPPSEKPKPTKLTPKPLHSSS